MADDEVGDGAAFDPTFAPDGPRRSTFTPPTGAAPTQPVPSPPSSAPLDDDALADALAADLSRINTGVVTVPPVYRSPVEETPAQHLAPTPSAEPVVEAPIEPTPVEEAPAPTDSAPPAPTDSVPPAVPLTSPSIDPVPFADAPIEPDPSAYPEAGTGSPASAQPSWAAPAPWMSFPAPDPSQAVSLPDPSGPPRHTVPAEAISPVDEPVGQRSSTLEMIEKLQAELASRQREALENSARSQQEAPPTEDAPPVEPIASPFISPQAPVSAWPFPNFADEPDTSTPAVEADTVSTIGADASMPEAEGAPAALAPETAPTALPAEAAPGVPASPEALEAPDAPAAPEAEPAAAAAPPPPWEQPMPDWSAPEPDARVIDPSPDEALPFIDSAAPVTADPPSPQLPAWEVPAPGPNWAPGPEYGIDPPPPAESEPELEPELESEPELTFADSAPESPVALQSPERARTVEVTGAPPAHPPGTAWEPQPWDSEPVVHAEIVPDEPDQPDEPDEPDEPDDKEVSPPAPPPLIEPSLHGPPVLPSQPAGRPPLVLSDSFGAPPTVTASTIGLTPPLDESVPPDESVPLDESVPTPGVATATPAYDFDDLLTRDVTTDEEPLLYRDAEPVTPAEAAPEAIFIEPMPVAAGGAVPTDTGSISVVDQAYEEELPDDVDETDRAVPGLGAVSVDTNGIAIVTGTIHPPSGPISTVRIPEDEVVLSNGEPVRMKVFSLEESGLEATPVDQRVGKSARLFWLWFASNSSILSLGLGAAVFGLGMSLRQSIVSVLAGVALSFIPLGLTTLAGKRSGMPTMVVSRATFGLVGNLIPALLALVTRVFWGAVLLWLLASSVAIVLVGAALNGGMGDRQLLLVSLAIAFLVALLVAFAGYPLFARIQLILSIVSAILVVGLIAMTWKYVNIAAALTTPDGPWMLTLGGTVLVFSFVGLVWANSGADLARYQRPGTSGAASMLWATVGTTLPTFALISYGALLAASDKGIATGFLGSPLDTLSRMLPSWYPVPLLAATGLSLLSGVILSLYSGGFALQAAGLRVRRQWSIVIVAVLLAAFAMLFTFGVTGGMNELFRDVATTVAVPTAAWAGIFAAEMMIRNRRFESQSLLVRGGVYADVRWFNLLSLIVISVIGYGFTTATITWLGWQGYGFTLLGMPLGSDLAASDVGVLVTLVLGLLVTFVVGVPGVRKQEALRPSG